MHSAFRITMKNTVEQQEVSIANEIGIETKGLLNLPVNLKGLVIFAHGSGSSRLSPRNQQVATFLNQKGIGTLLFDLLTDEESKNRSNVFDIPLLAARLVAATQWLQQQDFAKNEAIGFFGASTGAGAALWAAAELKNKISAVVSRGGRPDLATQRLKDVSAPTLLIVGDQDHQVISLNEQCISQLENAKLSLIPKATHLFEQPSTLEKVCEQASDWFLRYLKESNSVARVIAENAVPLHGRKDLSGLIEKLSQAKVVMLGESSHGTQEFYEWRRLISEELIANHGFNFIAVEGDWPPSAELNRYVHSETRKESARMALAHFQRWPTWMWANTEIMKLTQWMKTHNESRPKENRVSFFGLDVYSLFESIDEVLKQLRIIDPELAREVKESYQCFASFKRDERAYVKHLKFFPESCEKQVLYVLENLLSQRLEMIKDHAEELFDVEQNARIAKNAEDYYRTMILGDDDSWNVRDRHMIETLEILLKRFGPESKGIVWAHNTHIGDYRATNMVADGQINIGGLAREKWGADRVALLGFATYQGEVVASTAWDGPTKVMNVPPGQSASYEAHFHAAAQELRENTFYLWLKENSKVSTLSQVLGHRAIGVVYNPASELLGNYVPTSLSQRYDGFIFIDRTTALNPFVQEFKREEIPETWPNRF